MRIWLRIPGAAGYPSLLTGELAEFTFQEKVSPFECWWVPGVVGPGLKSVELRRKPILGVPGFAMQWDVDIETDEGDLYHAGSAWFKFKPCDERQFILPASPDPLLWGPTTVTQVRWYEDADLVPH